MLPGLQFHPRKGQALGEPHCSSSALGFLPVPLGNIAALRGDWMCPPITGVPPVRFVSLPSLQTPAEGRGGPHCHLGLCLLPARSPVRPDDFQFAPLGPFRTVLGPTLWAGEEDLPMSFSVPWDQCLLWTHGVFCFLGLVDGSRAWSAAVGLVTLGKCLSRGGVTD